MTESQPTGYRESPDTTDADSSSNMVDGTPGNDASDGGERDVPLTTDDEAQRDDGVARPGNTSD
ncbi:hypothetical protein ACI797_26605 [Geodermatophilus sp. SYSU D00691]